jgi:ATP-dependent helicase YprA (DUF1998 family)
VKTFRLADFTDDGALTDLDAARLFARKLGAENCLDFEDVTAVSSDFLDHLLAGQKPESLEGRIFNQAGAVDEALAAWIDRQQPGRTHPPPKTGTRAPVAARRKAAPPVEFNRPEPEGERYTPTRLINRLRQQLRSYIESAYPLSDPVLVRARRRLLEEALDGHLLAQEPYLETTPRYRTFAGSYGDLGLPAPVAGLFLQLAKTKQQHSKPEENKSILYPEMWQHQADAYRRFLVDGKDVIVATGTGSGKTECFLVPLLGRLFQEAVDRPESFARPGVRALILYPMNALVNDQLARLRLLVGDESVAAAFRTLGPGRRHPLFGMYTGRTPYPGPRDASKDRERVAPLLEYYTGLEESLGQELRRLGRYPAKDLESFFGKDLAQAKTYASGKRSGQAYTRHKFDQRLHTQPGDRELLTRQEMVRGAGTRPGVAPDVLVTNYSMLEYMLMRPFERPIFQQTAEWLQGQGNQFLLVLDEAHMYRGAKGAEVGFLLRRLRARLGINDRPDKLRVICTSASLGDSASALANIRCFAADLTGKCPEDFAPVTGKRAVPEPAAPGTAALAGLLAGIEMDHLHAAVSPSVLLQALTPLFEHLGKPCPDTGEEGILRHLFHALSGQPFVNFLLRETAGTARSLESLAASLFPGQAQGRKAVEVLVTLGSIAREKPGEPGLIPARIHGFFRGLHALYACINPACPGRQDRPGEVAVLGKLFAEPHTSCDACGSRVFELASCRNCGSPYLQAYCPPDRLGSLDFLWGETEGSLQALELLPIPPRYAEVAEEVRIHLPTGYVDREHTMPDNQVRSVWLAHGETGREPTYPRCAMCQPPGSRSRSRITDFRTKGEQPFTALIDAQFAEQPPQKADKRLANQGRKVLVFSDGRQKAARLAPALEHSHARDLFRQVLGIGAEELKKQAALTGLDKLYPAVIWVCHARGIDLFPAPDEDVFHDHLRRAKDKTLAQLIQEFNQGYLQPTQSFAQQLFGEMTDRYYSLNALALATVEEDPLVRGVFKNFPAVGLAEPEVLLLFRLWLRLQLENRRFAPPGADLSKLGEGWERPEGMDANNSAHVVPRPLGDFLRRVLKGEEPARQVETWLPRFIRESNLFLLSNDLFYLQPRGLSLNVKLDAGWLRCQDCARLYAETLGDCCPACLGKVVDADRDYLDARNGFYRQQMLRAFEGTGLEPFGVTAAEHSAQLTGKDDEEAFSKTERYELRFQDIPVGDEGPIDVLSCTTTMEVGIDIGSLCGVALRNVPPHVANYQQRAGRAGRRGRSVASVITFAHGTSHDSHYYEHPDHIISGDVNPPVVYIENQQVLRRHINAYLVQRFFHETPLAGADTFSLFESLGTVEQFLSDGSPCCLASLREWLQSNASGLTDDIRHWVPEFSYGLNEPVDVEETITASVRSLIDALTATLPVEAFRRREQLGDLAREGLERQLSEQLLQTLIDRAIFPRYAFPTDVVTFWVSRPKVKGDPPHKRSFDYEPQRDLQIALTEYAPGSGLTIDKYRFTSAALYSPYAPEVRALLQKAQSYTACKTCGYVSLQEEAGALAACPCCRGQDLFKQRFIVPEGFAPDINVRREVDRGDASAPVGRATRAQIEVQEPPAQWDEQLYGGRLAVIARAQNLVTVNKGVGDRGFMVCPECGRTEPVFGPGFTNPTLLRGGRPRRHDHPLEQGRTCDGKAVGPYFFGHRFPTDVLLLRLKTEGPVLCPTADEPGRAGRPGRLALTSLAEAVCLAASRILQIEEGELAGNWCPVVGGGDREVYLFLYDLLPGGAGYTRLVKQSLQEVLAEAERLLAGCDCLSSCYRCLRHFGNTHLHPSLDRHLAGTLLGHLLHGARPALSKGDKHAALQPLLDFCCLKQLEAHPGATRSGQEVPLVLARGDGSEIWVDVHHPLTDPDETAGLRGLAEGELAEFCSLDSFTVLHDLPAAVAALQL